MVLSSSQFLTLLDPWGFYAVQMALQIFWNKTFFFRIVKGCVHESVNLLKKFDKTDFLKTKSPFLLVFFHRSWGQRPQLKKKRVPALWEEGVRVSVFKIWVWCKTFLIRAKSSVVCLTWRSVLEWDVPASATIGSVDCCRGEGIKFGRNWLNSLKNWSFI